MDYTATGLLYLRAADELSNGKSPEYERRLSDAKEHLDACKRGVVFVLRGSACSNADYDTMRGLFAVRPEIRTMDKPIEYLTGFCSTLEQLVHGENMSTDELASFLEDLGTRYAAAGIASAK